MQPWILAIRPKTLLLALPPLIFAATLALMEAGFSAYIAFWTFVLAISVQIGANLANDYFDYLQGADTESRLGPTRVMQAGLVTEKAICLAMAFSFTLTLLAGGLLARQGGQVFLLISLLSILSAIFYTAGKSSIGYLGLGELFVFAFFGPVAVLASVYLYLGSLSVLAVVLSFIPGLFSTAVLVVNNLRDSQQDILVGKKTLAVRFGDGFARLEYLFCMLSPFAIQAYLVYFNFLPRLSLLSFLSVIFLPSLSRQVFEPHAGRKLNSVLARTSQLALLHALLFSLGALL